MKEIKAQAKTSPQVPHFSLLRQFCHSGSSAAGVEAQWGACPERAEGESNGNLRSFFAPAGKSPTNVHLFTLSLLAFLTAASLTARAQTPSAHQLVQQVIHNEVAANQSDHTKWMYRDADKTPSKDVVKLVIETSEASVSKTIQLNGRPLNAQQRQQDRARMQSVVNDPSVREKQRKDSAHDDKQALSLLRMLPEGFLWTYAGESNGEVTLRFKPNPAFQPPTYASRVFAAMAGEMKVDAKQKRLKMLSGTLIRPVEFGWGLFGKLEKGGTFRIVRSQVAPGEWEITQTHVHIQGHALFFKNISEQEDESTSDYKRTPASLTLEQALQMLTNGTVEKDLNAPAAK